MGNPPEWRIQVKQQVSAVWGSMAPFERRPSKNGTSYCFHCTWYLLRPNIHKFNPIRSKLEQKNREKSKILCISVAQVRYCIGSMSSIYPRFMINKTMWNPPRLMANPERDITATPNKKCMLIKIFRFFEKKNRYAIKINWPKESNITPLWGGRPWCNAVDLGPTVCQQAVQNGIPLTWTGALAMENGGLTWENGNLTWVSHGG